MTPPPRPSTPAGVVVVTDRRQAVVPLPRQVAGAVAGGARWVLLREKDLPPGRRDRLAQRLREVLAPYGARLIVAGPDPLGGDAIHLAATDPIPTLAPGVLAGRSCHRAADLDRLTVEEYVTVSPVFESTSKPGYGPPLRPDGLARLCARAGRPVLALGGVETPQRATACLAAGAAGVAVMGVVMRASDPAAVVAELVRAAGQDRSDSQGNEGRAA